MKTLLTGGTGYIGSMFLKKLVGSGEDIVALYHHQPPELQADNLQWVKGSLNDIDSLLNAMNDCNHVFHMAGLARVSHPDKEAFFNINVKGTENILIAAGKTGVEKLVYTSTASVMSYSISTPVNESDPLLEPLDDDYSVTKFIAETKVLNESKNGLQTVVVNPPRVFGPGKESESSPVNKLIKDYLHKPVYFIPSDGHYCGNFAFIDDVLDGHLLAMKKGRSGERYILGGENHDFIELYTALEQLTHLKRRRINVPRWVMNIATEFADLWSAISGTVPKITPAAVSKIFSNRLLTCEKAIRELGYHITPFTLGLEKTIASYQKFKS